MSSQQDPNLNLSRRTRRIGTRQRPAPLQIVHEFNYSDLDENFEERNHTVQVFSNNLIRHQIANDEGQLAQLFQNVDTPYTFGDSRFNTVMNQNGEFQHSITDLNTQEIETYFQNGTHEIRNADGSRVVNFPNGEIQEFDANGNLQLPDNANNIVNQNININNIIPPSQQEIELTEGTEEVKEAERFLP